MRAITVNAPDGKDAITFSERSVRNPSDGEIRIRVHAAAVNPADVFQWKSVGTALQPPFTPGMDIAGTVDSVGPGVHRLVVGQQVLAVVKPRRPEGGGQAELVVIPESWAVVAPEGVDLTAAATLPMNGLTALEGLRALNLPKGATLGVTGGAGQLASFVIPLARARGITVIADAKPDDKELVLSFGAHHVVARGDFARAIRQLVPDGVDAVYDTAVITRAALPAIRDNGSIAVVRGWDEPGEPERGITVHPVSVGTAFGKTEWLQDLADLAAVGVLPLRVAERVSPEDAQQAYRRMARGGVRGRIVFTF